MLHGIINEQGNCLDVRDDFLRIFLHTFSNKSLDILAHFTPYASTF